MKKIIALAVLLIVGATAVFAQHKKNPNPASPHETVKGKNMSITYGRPYKKGREIFGSLVPYGQVWRTGADEATTITFDKSVMVAGKPLEKGTYALFTIPNKDKWTIIFNKKADQWGSFGYDKVKDQDALQVDVPAKTIGNVTEEFTIAPKDDGIIMMWDNVQVMVPVKS